MSSKTKKFSLPSPKHQFSSTNSISTAYTSATSTRLSSLSSSRLGGGSSSGAPLPTSIKSGGGGTPKGKANVLSHVPTFTFPDNNNNNNNNNNNHDYSYLGPYLSPLRDNASSYESVTKSCLHISQFAGRAGSSESGSDCSNGQQTQQNTVMTSSLFHDASYAQTVSSALSALMDCIQNHFNRKCRIVASKTLASFARSSFARLRHTLLLFAVRDGTLHRLEDEIGTDVAVALATVALEDVDDGVSACAVEALGMLVLAPSCSQEGSIVDDELQREIERIANCRPSPWGANLLAALPDEDLSVPHMELQVRIYENVLSPRLWRLVHRITLYESSSQLARTLPFLTSCLVHIIKISPAKTYGIERTAYAKQWMELDSAGLVHDVVHLLLIPAMQSSLDAHLAYEAALNALRLAHVCGRAPWMMEVCELAAQICTEQLAGAEIVPEHTKMIMAATLIALRAMPLSDRLGYLQILMNEVRFIPSTTMIPLGVSSPGVIVPTLSDGTTCFRTPSRMGILSEIALSLIADGPSNERLHVHGRSETVSQYLSSSVVSTIMASRSKSGGGDASSAKRPNERFAGTHIAEELVYTFCTTVSAAGRCILMKRKRTSDDNTDNKPSPLEGETEDGVHDDALMVEEWIRCSYAILSNVSSCLNWHSRAVNSTGIERTAADKDEDQDPQTLFTMGLAAQASYIQLLQESLYVVGLLSPSTSVSLTILPREAPTAKSILLDQLGVESLKLAKCIPPNHRLSNLARANIKNLMDQFVEYKLREGVPSRHMRIFLLSLLVDQWVQQRRSTSMADLDTNEAVTYQGMANLDDINAREILANLSTEISIEKAISAELEDPIEESRTTGKGYLPVCVACIENIALTACDMKRRFRDMNTINSSKAKVDESFLADFEDDANYILALSMFALRGKNLKDGDESDAVGDEEERGSNMLPLCVAAAKRIETASLSDTPMQEDTAWGLGSQPALYSDLVVDRDRNGWTSPKKNRSNKRLDLYSLADGCGFDKDSSYPASARCYAHMWLLCRQSVLSHIDGSFLSSPLGDAYIHNESQGSRISRRALQRNWLHLGPPPVPLSLLGPPREDSRIRLSQSTVVDTTAASDPVSLALAFVVKRIPRYDYEREYRLTVTMRLHNVTAVEIANGLRLELGITKYFPTSDTDLDQISMEIAEALGSSSTDTTDHLATCATAVYKTELAAGDHLTWELSLGNLPAMGSVKLSPFIVFRGIETEQSVSSWAGPSFSSDNDNAEDEIDESEDDGNEDETIDVRLPGEPVQISPMISLQPCPLVFFRTGSGDIDTFRTLWFHAPYKIPNLLLREPDWNPSDLSGESWHGVAAMSSLSVPEGVTSEGIVMKFWAFMSFSGKRVFCVTTREKNTESNCTLHVRGDDKDLLLSLFGNESARSEVIYAMTSAVWLCTLDGKNGQIFFEA